MRPLFILVLCLILSPTIAQADVTSGPTEGATVAKLPVYAVFGEFTAESVDIVAKRAEKPTLYCLVPADKFSRPTYRLIKTLNEKLAAASPDAKIVAVWVTGNVEDSKSYLTRAKGSLEASLVTYCVAEGDASGPAEWGFNSDADITIVVVDQGKVKKSFGFVSANETVVDEVLKALK